MELFWTLLLALPTIFLAAFLASALENVRERMRTRKWVMRNLRQLADDGRFDSPKPFRDAMQRWLDAESPDDMDEDAWRRAWALTVSNAPDLSPLLRSEAATAVPAHVFTALHEFEGDLTNMKQVENYVRDLFVRDVAPLWYERRVPLTGADRQRVRLLIGMIDSMSALSEQVQSRSFEQLRRAVRKG